MPPFARAARLSAWLLLCWGSATAPLWAQTLPAATSRPPPPAPGASAADPTEARAPVPPLRHRSAFEGYRPLGELKPVPWREANDTVTRIGGWRTYTRQAHAPEPAASTPPAASAPAAPHHPPRRSP